MRSAGEWVGAGMAATRATLGLVALARPSLVARPWVGRGAADSAAGAVLGRALGARDLALGAGALFAAARGAPGALADWTAAGAVCDAVDALATVTSWRGLPARTRPAVAVLAAGGAATGVLVLWLLRPPPRRSR